MIYFDHINDIVCIQWSMNLNLHIKWDACNFLQCTFFQKHYNYIFVYGYILISRYILNFKCSLKCTHVFTFILVDPIGLTLEIFVKFLKLFLLKYTYCQRHFKQNFKKFWSNICSRQRNGGLWTKNTIYSQKML